jgi:hypothetical protein
VYGRVDTPHSTFPRTDITIPLLEQAFAAIDPGPTDRQIIIDRLRRHRRVLSPLAKLTDASASAFTRPILARWKRENGIAD